MAVVGIELETLISEPDALTTRPPPCEPEYNLKTVKHSRFPIKAMSI